MTTDSIIPTPYGNKKASDLKVGDYLFNRYGKPTKITEISNKKSAVYEVILYDGRKIICDKNERFSYYTSKNNLKTILLNNIIHNSIKSRYNIPMNNCVEFEKKSDLIIDPYLLGCFIGNGCNLEKRLTLSSNDLFTINTCADILGATPKKCSQFNYSWNFIKDRNKLNTKDIFGYHDEQLCVKSHLKSIPIEYKYATIENRWSLIQGLFDTDGTIGNNDRANVRYSTSSLQLANDVREILWSLGFTSTIHEDKREENINYIIYVCVDNKNKSNFFRLPRKLERIPTKIKRKKYDRIVIVSINELHKKKDLIHIKVDDSEGFYLGENYIVINNWIGE